MKKISSGATPFFKYVVPWTVILALFVGIILSLIGGNFYPVLAIVIIGTPVVGFMRSMLMNLKDVFLDKENKTLIVKGTPDESIPYADIKEILRPITPPYIATVQLTRDYSFGRTFTFQPVNHPMFGEDYGDELMTKVRK